MEKKLWVPVDRELIRPPSWNTVRRGRRQKKRRLQPEELVVQQKGGKSKMKRVGTVTMTCSLCGLSGHNKRYHDKRTASNELFVAEQGDHSIQDCGSQSGKLQPRRATKSASSQTHEPLSGPAAEFQFMPTPSVIPQHMSGPAADIPGNDLQQNLSFENMVDDLQLMQNEEQARMKAQRAKNKSILRDSVRMNALRKRKPD
ncbi:Uncharacterized protein Adt_06806 [Abeliophyllum distichum]|uniref:Uncharacterized protein n=1 Tax=Abeliophyllum distichum TaxID=126358 RepID=A0ABD1V7Z8_9LAMI